MSDEDRDRPETGQERLDRESAYHDRASGQLARGGTGWGVAALIVSILSVVLLLLGPLNILVAVAGLVLGIVARSRGSRGMGLAAIILSVVAILLGALLLVALILLFNNPEFQQQLQQLQEQVR